MSEHSKQLQSRISFNFDEPLLVQILQKINKCKDCVVTDITFNNDSKKGDSYLSTVTRFVVKFNGNDERTNTSKSYVFFAIAKSLPSNIGRRKTFRSVDFFRNEVIFYNTVWPALDKFQKSIIPEGVFNAVPLCLSAFTDGNNDYIVLEDLTPKNFTGVNRSRGLDLQHVYLIMRLFAKFHALAFAFKHQQPSTFEKIACSLEETYFAEKFRPWYEEFQTKTVYKVFRDAVEKQLPKYYLDKLNEFLRVDLFGSMIDHCKSTGRFSVITHGDAWIPNFLINYNQQKNPVEAIMIDFQLTRYASLANDITFFLYSCTDLSLQIKHWDYLIEDYHQTFQYTLKCLGSDPNLLTLDDLKSEIKARAVYGIGMSMEALIMSLLEDHETADLDLIQGDEQVPLETVWIVHRFKQEEKRQRLADLIMHAVDNNFI